MADYLHGRYNFGQMGISLRNKRGEFNNADTFNLFSRLYGKINMLIGIARKEEGRVSVGGATLWQQRSIIKVYPLLDIGYDRSDCQQYIASVNEPVPMPSNCILCPKPDDGSTSGLPMSKLELLWLYTFLPAHFYDWVEKEKNKIAKDLELRLTSV